MDDFNSIIKKLGEKDHLFDEILQHLKKSIQEMWMIRDWSHLKT